MRILFRLAVGAVAALTILISVALWTVSRMVEDGPLGHETAVVIPRGSGTEAIAHALADAGVIDKPALFALGTRLVPGNRPLRAGEYLFPAGISMVDTIELLRSGRTVVHRLTVPEGLTSAQIVAMLQAEPALSGEIAKTPPEGSLLPETYHFSWGDSRAEILNRMQTAMTTLLAELWVRRSDKLPLAGPEQAVTLASIVEKETAVREERPRIAGVFVNRLERRMRLQSDPTVVYALNGGAGPLGRPLTRADWKMASPYNTYAVDGLPPGPIANPGRASLEAAVNPERNDYLYFVADGTGHHAFAETLPDHNKNVVHWRGVQKDTAQQGDSIAE